MSVPVHVCVLSTALSKRCNKQNEVSSELNDLALCREFPTDMRYSHSVVLTIQDLNTQIMRNQSTDSSVQGFS